MPPYGSGFRNSPSCSIPNTAKDPILDKVVATEETPKFDKTSPLAFMETPPRKDSKIGDTPEAEKEKSPIEEDQYTPITSKQNSDEKEESLIKEESVLENETPWKMEEINSSPIKEDLMVTESPEKQPIVEITEEEPKVEITEADMPPELSKIPVVVTRPESRTDSAEIKRPELTEVEDEAPEEKPE